MQFLSPRPTDMRLQKRSGVVSKFDLAGPYLVPI